MYQTLVVMGVCCVLGAIVGGGLKMAGSLELPGVNSLRRQLLLAIAGFALIGWGFYGLKPGGAGPSTPSVTNPGTNPATNPVFPIPASDLTMTIAPDRGRKGTTVTVTGGGAAAGQTVNLSFQGRPLGQTTADPQGNFRGQLTIPADWPFTGPLPIIASAGARSATRLFEVTP